MLFWVFTELVANIRANFIYQTLFKLMFVLIFFVETYNYIYVFWRDCVW